MGGASLLAIGTIPGNKTASMTKRYSHLSPGHLKSADEGIDRAINHTGDLLTHFCGPVEEISPSPGPRSA